MEGTEDKDLNALTSSQSSDTDIDEPIGIGCALESFKEELEIQNIISDLKNSCASLTTRERSYEKFKYIIDLYQEQPHLLDPYLEPFLNQLLDIVRCVDNDDIYVHEAFKYLQLLTKVRGYKVIVRLFPHEVVDLECALALLNKQDINDTEAYESQYIILLWLSIVCLVPFDLAKLDSTNTGEPIRKRILTAVKPYLTVCHIAQKGAAYMLAKFMTRTDTKRMELEPFIRWVQESISNIDVSASMSDEMSAQGMLTALSLIYKHSEREDVLPYAPSILHTVLDRELLSSKSTLVRKLSIKLVQRLGLTFLTPRVSTWRYQRGNRCLAQNLDAQPTQHSQGDVPQHSRPEPSEPLQHDSQQDIPEDVEVVIEQLLGGVRDSDKVVRWSSAKGIGRVTSRLSQTLADDVVGYLLDLFTLSEGDGAWEGGCLALAELARRGLLLPDRLTLVMPVILKALLYDERRGYTSIGSHVRDAACYVCWAFARCYEPAQIRTHINDIARALLIVTVFDREVTCRRAASAAFQENVGRQGQFPHGIDILTTADYHTVGRKSYCYTQLSVFLSQFTEYRQHLIDHLVDVKIHHWDANIRELTAVALHNLTPIAKEYMAQQVLQKLIPNCTNIDVNSRHGAILAIGEICHALSLHCGDICEVVDDALLTKCINMVDELYKRKLFQGLNGDIMRQAACHLIHKLSLSNVPTERLHHTLHVWKVLIDECLAHSKPEIRDGAGIALHVLSKESYEEQQEADQQEVAETDSDNLQQQQQSEQGVVEEYVRHAVNARDENERCGACLALGSLPESVVRRHTERVVSTLVRCAAAVTPGTATWVQARCNALHALATVTAVAVRTPKPGTAASGHNMSAEMVESIYECIFTSFTDYTTDSRGDAGRLVRQAAISAAHTVTERIVSSPQHAHMFTAPICKRLFCLLVQQMCEKIDQLRDDACRAFYSLLHSKDPSIKDIPEKQKLLSVFTTKKCGNINWRKESETFPLLGSLLALPTYRYYTLLGLTVSSGGLSETTSLHATKCLLNYMATISGSLEDMVQWMRVILSIFTDYAKNDRIIIPLLHTMSQLLTSNHFAVFTDNNRLDELVEMIECCKTEAFRCGVMKTLAVIDVYCALIQFPGDIRQSSLKRLTLYLGHMYPKVRKVTADKLYETFITYDDIVEDDVLDPILTLLSDTNWTDSDHVNNVRPKRNELCKMLAIPIPVKAKQ